MPSRTNMFCTESDLANEASVEQFFASRLLEELGYTDSQIAPKESLETLSVNQGRRRVNYRPDYALKYRRKVRWVCDAKAVTESLDDWVGQCASYCLELNRRERGNPVQYFMLTNGIATDVYAWDSDVPLMRLNFEDFAEGSRALTQLRYLLAPQAFAAPRSTDDNAENEVVTLQRRTVSELNSDFAWAHRHIWRRESLSYGSAFMEFVKVIFLKLLSDREVHSNPHAEVADDGSVTVPAGEVKFSVRWIESLEKDHPNPMDAVQFTKLLADLEVEISDGTKKRIFAKNEHIRLSNETVKALAGRFQYTDLYGIDTDLNGRMFETFLNATLRGKDLGQYFTPRSVAKLATRIADLQASPGHTDVVVDACCGTGGFLIEALTEMWKKIDENGSLSETERKTQKRIVAEQSLYGVDIARDPALARIARINMYLHGDGGSRIYQLDALDKKIRDIDNDDVELRGEKREFRKMLANHPNGFADVVLTNPPFAKEYSRSQDSEAELLDDYDLAFDTSGRKRKELKTLRSSIMFIERYYDLLIPGGLLVSVVDDGILGGDNYDRVRRWIRERFLIRAVISLPGDAFQRSQARVKTSILLMEKRKPGDAQAQPPVFMYYCTAVGVDDSPRQRVLPIDEHRRREADAEIARVVDLYADFRAGRSRAKKWTVAGAAIQDRMDVKAVLPKPGAGKSKWKASGFEVTTLGDLVDTVYKSRARDVIETAVSPDNFVHLRVRYDGFVESGDEVEAADSNYRHLYVVREGDLVISHINAIHGAVAVVPAEFDGHVVTNEYSVCRPTGDLDVRIVWALMRSPIARSDMLLLSTGIGRTRIDWPQAARLELPLPSLAEQAKIVETIQKAEEAERSARRLRDDAANQVLYDLLMDSAAARKVIAAFKPPR